MPISFLRKPASCAFVSWLAVLGQNASAQSLPGPDMPSSTGEPAAGSPARARLDVRLRDAIASVRAGDRRRALQHFEAALRIAPSSREVLRAMLDAELAGSDPRPGPVLQRYWLACMDAKGKLRLERALEKSLGEERVAAIERLALARAAAVAELARFASKLPRSGTKALGNGVLARWACDLAIELTRRAPSLREAHAASFHKALAAHTPDYATVLAALSKVAQRAPKSAGVPERAREIEDLRMRAARCLTGLGAQAAFPKLEGPRPPDVSRITKLANAARDKLRKAIGASDGELFTVERLRAMKADERERFTAEHARWSQPAVGISPSGLYRVETTCGHATLLGALETVELHHRRLANWYGKDPFRKRQGIVRIVPDSTGLESEGSPFWWAGGFQAGDVTVVKFAWGSIAGLGRTLTHELTHRFDGVLRSSLPAWLGEGRAVWTASAYGNAGDEHFVDRYLSPYAMQTALVRGYGGSDKLRRLLEGKIDDYRDNYPVGHALFAFLRSWQTLDKKGAPVDGRKVFEKRLDAYMRRIRAGRKKPFDFFVAHFADGKQGRPDSWGAFLKEWNAFLSGCYKKCWNESVPWLEGGRYTTQRSRVTRGARVLDEPTFTWSRARAEPWFGQLHAAHGAWVLERAGMRREAAAAYLWALRTDGYTPRTHVALEELMRGFSRKDVSWVLARERAHRSRGAAQRPAPMLAQLPKTRAFLAALEAHVAACRREKQLGVARVFAEELRHSYSLAGGLLQEGPEDEAQIAFSYPARDPGQRLDLLGLVEEGLSGYEEKRAPECWFVDDEGHLHVGRHEPRDKTGVLDRRIHIRHAYVRAKQWQPAGRYVIRTRVHFTTSHVNGAIVFGLTRRDRYLATNFVAGDYLYAIGRSDEVKKSDSVRVGTSGRWDREGGLGLTSRSKKVAFAREASSFALEILVDGPTASVSINGKPVHTYTTPKRTPIEGYVGAAMSSGAVRLQEPVVQRLDRERFEAGAKSAGLRLDAVRATSVAELLGAPAQGFPREAQGTALVWFPAEEGEKYQGRCEAIVSRVAGPWIRDGLAHPQRWVFVIPSSWDDERKAALRVDVAGYGPERVQVLEHRAPAPLDKGPWLLFLDELGVLRSATRLRHDGRGGHEFWRWLRQYRSRAGVRPRGR